MIKITNGINTIEVSTGAFKDIYKGQGYYPYEEDKSSPEVNSEPQDDTSDKEPDSDLIEKPISQWTKDEIVNFAKEHDIDISGTKNAGKAKEIIKSYFEAKVAESNK